MISRDWLNYFDICCNSDNDDPWDAYPNYYIDCDDDLELEEIEIKTDNPSKCKVQSAKKGNICPDCLQEGEITQMACICVNEKCSRRTIWGM
jgi:hypothetical protein